jgi:hypothetical protein
VCGRIHDIILSSDDVKLSHYGSKRIELGYFDVEGIDDASPCSRISGSDLRVQFRKKAENKK